MRLRGGEFLLDRLGLGLGLGLGLIFSVLFSNVFKVENESEQIIYTRRYM